MPRRNRPQDSIDVKVSKNLSRILRHKAEAEGFTLMKGGFLYIDDLLRHESFAGVTLEQIQEIVQNNDKQRFTIEADEESNRLKIRANQGHSLKVDDLDLRPITNPADFPVVVHGTNEKAYTLIQTQGLKRMSRNHVHFAPGEPGDDGVISGMRSSCTVLVYLNLSTAMEDGLEFYQSANNVILCSGNQDGVILPKYFEKVKNRRSGKTISVSHSDGACAPSDSPVVTDSAVTAEHLADELDQRKAKRKNKK